MSAHAFPNRIGRARGFLIWLLVLALVAYCHSSVMLQLLGPAHRHEFAAIAAAPAWLDRVSAVFRDLQAWRADMQGRLLLARHADVRGGEAQHAHPHTPTHPHGTAEVHADRAGILPPHAHEAYQRHHHDRQDASVIALDGPDGSSTSDATSAAVTGSAVLPLALAPGWKPSVAAEPERAWRGRSAPSWTDAALIPLERPLRT